MTRRNRFLLAMLVGVAQFEIHHNASAQVRDLSPIYAARRMALVVGIDSYAKSPLQNALNDARDMAAVLRQQSFSVTLIENSGREELASAIGRFGAALRANDLAWIFFAGHGVQVRGENFLIPADFNGTSETEVRLSAMPVSELQNAVSKARVSIIVLDACRNNPFLGSRSGTGGLAPVEAQGNLIAFATAAGQTASDNTAARNGLFTQELLKQMQRPGISIRDVFFRVRQEVFDASRGRQFPAVYDGLLGDLTLAELQTMPPATTEPAVKPTSTPAAVEPSRRGKWEIDWHRCRRRRRGCAGHRRSRWRGTLTFRRV